MEQEYYPMNLETWANSIIEQEDDRSYNTSLSGKVYSDGSSLVSVLPTYYRSKGFSSHIGINNLINAADPIITLVTKLRKITVPPEVTTLHENICHEIKAFENKAQTFGYRQPMIMASQYVICALLDEQIALTLWPETEWKKYSLVETFHKDSWEEDRFFVILERSLQDPAGHLDLLELIYLCLRLGYEGKYRAMERGHLELRNITDYVYNVISQHREEFSRSLLVSLESPNFLRIKKRTYFHLLPPTWMTSSVMIVSIVMMFSFFYFKLMKMASPVSQFLSTLTSTQESTERTPTAK